MQDGRVLVTLSEGWQGTRSKVLIRILGDNLDALVLHGFFFVGVVDGEVEGKVVVEIVPDELELGEGGISDGDGRPGRNGVEEHEDARYEKEEAYTHKGEDPLICSDELEECFFVFRFHG